MKKEGARDWHISYIIPIIAYVAFTLWWLYLRGQNIDSNHNARQLWGATYQLLAWIGAFAGLIISRKWGGYKSQLGRIILAFSIGLFLQCFGQIYSSLYVYLNNVESPPYPAIGDIGFFGSVVAYIYAVVLLSKISGVGVPIKKIHNKLISITIPILFLFGSYSLFLRGYAFDWANPVTVFLDFGYPFGQAFYVSIALLSLFMSRSMLGGLMRKPISLLFFALIFQYFSDTMFLFEFSKGSWYVGNINDFLYSTSYFIMAISLVLLGRTFEKVKNS